MKKRSLTVVIMTLIMAMIPTFAFAEEASDPSKVGNYFLYIGLALLAALVISMIVYGRKKEK